MLRFRSLTLFFALAFLLLPQAARADRGQGPDERPSLLSYGFDGLFAGGLTGLSMGYLATGSHYESDEWKALVFGAGVGALAGLGGGVAAAVVDSNTDGPPTGAIILNDMWYGLLLGGAAGALVGALVLIYSDHPKDVLTGAAIGAISGDAVGLTLGIFESAARRRRYKSSSRSRPPRLTASINLWPEGGRSLAVLPALSGKF